MGSGKIMEIHSVCTAAVGLAAAAERRSASDCARSSDSLSDSRDVRESCSRT